MHKDHAFAILSETGYPALHLIQRNNNIDNGYSLVIQIRPYDLILLDPEALHDIITRVTTPLIHPQLKTSREL